MNLQKVHESSQPLVHVASQVQIVFKGTLYTHVEMVQRGAKERTKRQASHKNSHLWHLNSNIHIQVWFCYCAKKITSDNFDTHWFPKTELSFHRGGGRGEWEFGSPSKT